MNSWEKHYQEFVTNWCESNGRNPPAKNPRAVIYHPPQEEIMNEEDKSVELKTKLHLSSVKTNGSVKVQRRQPPVKEEFVTKSKKAKTSFNRGKTIPENKTCSGIEGSQLQKELQQMYDEIPCSTQKMNKRFSVPAESVNALPLTYYPTMEQMENFEAFVAHMESLGAHREGIARIIPPKEWIPRKAGYEPSEMTEIIIKKPVKQDMVSTGVPGAFTTFGDRSLPPLTLPKYISLASNPTYLAPSHKSHEELEELYWKQNQDASNPSPLYAADVEASLTDADQEIFNIPKLHSLLSGMEEKFPGINLPYLYIGMWRATFSWHVEDMDLYGVNYLHHGAPKTWYCVPPQYGYKLEQLAQKLFPDMTETCFNLLRHKAVMIGPEILKVNNIPFNKLVHEQGTIMVVFPHAYHAGFNHGFNMAEAINFALPRWVEYGKRFRFCVCNDRKKEVVIDMEQFIEKIQPEKLELWRNGQDFALHPEDPEFLKTYWEDLNSRLELGFINKHLFGKLKDKLRMKREIDPWFRKKFPIGYAEDLELVTIDKNQNNIVGQKDATKFESNRGGNSHGELEISESKSISSTKVRHRFKACTKCSGCLEKNCNACVNCMDKPRNGGMNVIRQRCVKRICKNPEVSVICD